MAGEGKYEGGVADEVLVVGEGGVQLGSYMRWREICSGCRKTQPRSLQSSLTVNRGESRAP